MDFDPVHYEVVTEKAPQMYDEIVRFCEVIEYEGGIFRETDGVVAPVGEPYWRDLGECYVRCCDLLGRTPIFGKDPR